MTTEDAKIMQAAVHVLDGLVCQELTEQINVDSTPSAAPPVVACSEWVDALRVRVAADRAEAMGKEDTAETFNRIRWLDEVSIAVETIERFLHELESASTVSDERPAPAI